MVLRFTADDAVAMADWGILFASLHIGPDVDYSGRSTLLLGHNLVGDGDRLCDSLVAAQRADSRPFRKKCVIAEHHPRGGYVPVVLITKYDGKVEPP